MISGQQPNNLKGVNKCLPYVNEWARSVLSLTTLYVSKLRHFIIHKLQVFLINFNFSLEWFSYLLMHIFGTLSQKTWNQKNFGQHLKVWSTNFIQKEIETLKNIYYREILSLSTSRIESKCPYVVFYYYSIQKETRFENM